MSGRLVCWPSDGDLLGDREVVGLGFRPVDQPDRLVLLADAGLDLHAVAQQVVDVAVGLVQVAAAAERGFFTEYFDRPVDLGGVVVAAFEVLFEPSDLNIGVFLAVLPVSEVREAQSVAEQVHDVVLRFALEAADVFHVVASSMAGSLV